MKKNKVIALSILTIILMAIPGFTESVFLKNGTIFEGKVVKENDSSLTLVSSDNTKIEIQRSNIIRVLFHKNYKTKKYLNKMNGDVIEMYLVDEDNSNYYYRTDLNSPDEVVIPKSEVNGITKTRLEVKVEPKEEKSFFSFYNDDESKDKKKTEPKGKKKNNSKKTEKNNDNINNLTDGFALLGGLGVPYGILGIQGSYYYHILPSFTIVPYLALSSAPIFSGPFGIALGSMFTYGSRHRLFVDLGYVCLTNSISAFSAAPGYEFCANNGFVFRISFGAVVDPTEGEFYPWAGSSIALGYKF